MKKEKCSMILAVMKKDKIKLIIFFALFLVFSICINVVHPITPKYVNSLEIPEYWFFLFYSAMALGQVIGGISWGFLSDKIGRKWILITGIVGYCLSQILFGYVNQYVGLIILFRFFSGIFASAPVTLFVSMALDFAKDSKAKATHLMILSSFSILGQSLGYEIGGSIYKGLNATFQEVFLVQLGIGLFVSLIFALAIKDVNKEPIAAASGSTPSKGKSKFSFKNFKNLNVLLYVLLIALFILTIGQIFVEKSFDKYITDIGYEPDALGHYMLITGLVACAANLIFIPLIKKAKNMKLALLLSSFIATSGILVFITFCVKVNNIMYLLFSTHLIYLVLKTMIQPLEQAEISTYSDINNNGQIMGARQTILSLGKVIGPSLASVIYIPASNLVFIVAGCIIFGALLIYLIYFFFKFKKMHTPMPITDQKENSEIK